jgi:hypothetical protein
MRITRPAGAGADPRIADAVRVYDPGAPDLAVLVDLQIGDGPGMQRLAVAPLTRADAVGLAGAILRELGPTSTMELAQSATIRETIADAIAAADAHNGWPNRETWNTALWIGNDEGAYGAACEIVASALADADGAAAARYGPFADAIGATGPDADRRAAMAAAEDTLRDWYDETFGPEDRGTPLADAWQYAMARTDWRRVAEAFAPDGAE